MIKAYGYENNNESLLELQEVTIQCDIIELENIIAFLEEVKAQHGKADGNEICHSHYRDSSSARDKKSADFIVVTPLIGEETTSE